MMSDLESIRIGAGGEVSDCRGCPIDFSLTPLATAAAMVWNAAFKASLQAGSAWLKANDLAPD
jgi:hypothetical protein